MNGPPHDDEEFERIPWGHLSSSAPPGRANWRLAAYGLAGAIAVAGITASLVSGGDSTPAAATTAVTTTVTAVASTTAPTPTSAAVTEQDLMAVRSDIVAAEAGAWAEVLSEAYWSIDGTGVWALTPYLPPNAPLPTPVDGQRVFVESVRALTAAEESPGLYRVVVRASLLSAIGTEGYQRLPAAGLAWTLRWEREGWRLVDLPEQVDVPLLLPAPPQPRAELPEVIRSAASQFGTVLEGGPVGDLWRVLIAVEDTLGGSWPTVRWFSPDGIEVAR